MTLNLNESPLPPNFSLAQYRFYLETLTPLELQPFKGSALRGGFGYLFKQLVCAGPEPCGQTCRRVNSCPYGYIFETSPPEGAEALRNFSEVPRPFVIEPPEDRRKLIPPGQRLDFGLTLIGKGMGYLPYFVAVFRELGRAGLGASRGRYRLAAVEAVRPYQREISLLYRDGTEVVGGVELAVTAEMALERAAALPTGRLELELLTPARLKHEGRWVGQGPPFAVVVKTLLSRVSSLSYFHCGAPFEADFRGLIDRAAGVEIERNETRWQDWARSSGRQQQRVEMGGLVGRVSYAGDLAEFLPLLALGELVHVGKGTVFGNGQYRLIP